MKKRVSNHFIYTVIFLAGVIIALSLIYVTAQGSAPNPGHDVGDIGGIPTCNSGEYLTRTSNGWSCQPDQQGPPIPPPTGPTCTELTDPNNPLVVIPAGGIIESIISLPTECAVECILILERHVNGQLTKTRIISYTQSQNSNPSGSKYWQVHGGNSGNNGDVNEELIVEIFTGGGVTYNKLLDDSITGLIEQGPNQIFIRMNTDSLTHETKLFHCK